MLCACRLLLTCCLWHETSECGCCIAMIELALWLLNTCCTDGRLYWHMSRNWMCAVTLKYNRCLHLYNNNNNNNNNNNIIYEAHNVSKAEPEVLAVARWFEIGLRTIRWTVQVRLRRRLKVWYEVDDFILKITVELCWGGKCLCSDGTDIQYHVRFHFKPMAQTNE